MSDSSFDKRKVCSCSSQTPERRKQQPKQAGQLSPFLKPNSQSSSSSKLKKRYKYIIDNDTHELETDNNDNFFEGYSMGFQDAKKKNKRSSVVRTTSLKNGGMRPLTQSPILSSEHSLPAANASASNITAARKNSSTFSPRLHAIVQELVDRENHRDTRAVQELQEELIEEISEEDEEDVVCDSSSVFSSESFTLRERQDAINITHPFGIRIWKPALYKKNRSVQKYAEGDIHSRHGKDISWLVYVGNVLWTLTFGLILFLACTTSALSCLILFWSPSAQLYGITLLSVGKYLLFPFGICVQLYQDENYSREDSNVGHSYEEYALWQERDNRRLFFGPMNSSVDAINCDSNVENSNNSNSSSFSNDLRRKRRLFGRGEWNLGRIIFYFWYYALIMPLLYITSLAAWFGVFSIPVAKVTSTIASHLRQHPLALSFKPASKLENLSNTEYNASILLCTYRAFGIRYYKYTIDGTNIFLINLMFPVFFVIFDYYILSKLLHLDYFFTSNYFIFIFSLVAVIPLAYFIGQAVASISAQTSMGMGATINAFFSTIVEVFLYTVALDQGKGDLVEGSIVGSIFAGILLLPGLSMCAGAVKRKTQRYNPNSAGVSSTMLLFAIIGAFAPTIFYHIYGSYELKCVPCENKDLLESISNCNRCHFDNTPLTTGPFYSDILQPFSYWCSLLLFVSYCIGLWFSLRTHAALIWASQSNTNDPVHTKVMVSEEHTINSTSSPKKTDKKIFSQNSLVEPPPLSLPLPVSTAVVEPLAKSTDGHDAPNWSRNKSTVILLGATILYAIIAEILVDTVDVVLNGSEISEKFLGITLFALVPNTTEFLNAISFAMHGNVSLSMEIGSAYALQVCLLQIPALVLYSIWMGPVGLDITDYMFTLIFPSWDLFMVISCVFVFSYIYAEGKSNYFKGSILLLSYLVVMLGFYYSSNNNFTGTIDSYKTMASISGNKLQFFQQHT